MVVRRRGFSYEFDEKVVPQQIGEGFADGFEEMGFKAGQTVQFGWMILNVVAGPQGLELHEPDMSGVLPVRYVPGITGTILDTMRQRYVTDSVGLTDRLKFPSIVQSVIVCTGLKKGEGLFVTRPDPPDGHASGWVSCCVQEKHDHNNPQELKLISLYDLACQHPEVVEFLGMPVGSMIVLRKGERPELSMDGQALAWAPGSYLAARFT
jgi:hypothetical protein